MHLSRIDLNLLVVFDTIYAEGSIRFALLLKDFGPILGLPRNCSSQTHEVCEADLIHIASLRPLL
jgi:hypothetical protein